MLRSWDRFEIPLPFSRALFVYGEPFTIPPHLDSEGREHWRQQLETRLNALSDEGESRFDELFVRGTKGRQG